MPTIRPATLQDAPAIAAIHTGSWRETYAGLMPADFLARMTDDAQRGRRAAFWAQNIAAGQDAVLVAEDAGAVIAFASAGAPRDHEGYDAELFTLYSRRAVQGRGTGRALLRAVADTLQARGAQSMALWVLDVNPTRHWYARQGAAEAGEKVQPIPGGELREVRMVWADLSTVAAGP
ncbi:GNAT family N-acetyltransferase [Deinococcus multiflagellatus]|uniref:GNAT family N-acetyltransferase n=1 Tax=Deinococcus multiflagellatus TaxID=1656887 RepID=A0ABW1ZN64_9DEIO|nr:GNAT family N-acetyltransferase [Deinococcus multiflagellatus]MBZ9713375.1 GNAT family N-acetyltransferase [Deinococcus multiflagellatus]